MIDFLFLGDGFPGLSLRPFARWQRTRSLDQKECLWSSPVLLCIAITVAASAQVRSKSEQNSQPALSVKTGIEGKGAEILPWPGPAV